MLQAVKTFIAISKSLKVHVFPLIKSTYVMILGLMITTKYSTCYRNITDKNRIRTCDPWIFSQVQELPVLYEL